MKYSLSRKSRFYLIGIFAAAMIMAALAYAYFTSPTSALSRTGAKNDCGPQALVALLQDYRIKADPDTIARLAGTDDDGTTMLGLKRAAESYGLTSEGMRLSITALTEKLENGHGVIAFVNGDHYVHIKRAHALGFVVKDRDPGYRFISKEDWARIWFEDSDDAVDQGEGLCLVFAPPAFFRPNPKPYIPAKAGAAAAGGS